VRGRVPDKELSYIREVAGLSRLTVVLRLLVGVYTSYVSSGVLFSRDLAARSGQQRYYRLSLVDVECGNGLERISNAPAAWFHRPGANRAHTSSLRCNGFIIRAVATSERRRNPKHVQLDFCELYYHSYYERGPE